MAGGTSEWHTPRPENGSSEQTGSSVELPAKSRATPDIVSIPPAEVGVKKIGHFGFFRPEHRDTLWRGAAEWLQAE